MDALGQDNNSADESKAAISPLLSESLLTPTEKKKGDAPPPSLDDTWQTDKSTEQVSARQTESKPKPSSTIWPEELITQTQQTGAYQPIALPEDEALFAPLASKPRSRAWGWLSLILTLGLALQLIYFNRVRIAMEFPALQPRFTTLCEKLYCDMPLPRDASQLRLEWSELSYVPDHQTRIQLSATLRNLALYNQALPKMELTLTDKLEGIVARRVFQPEEYLSAAEKKRTQLGAYDELHAYVELDIGELKSTGYSLYWFYD